MRKVIFLDRDGTLNKDTGHTYKTEDLEILPGVIKGLKKLQDMGYEFIVISNQAGIARGYYSWKDLATFNNELAEKLDLEGIKILHFLSCPHHPIISGGCACRKPGNLLVLASAKLYSLEPGSCIYVGDKDSDIKLGINCKGTTVRIINTQYPETEKADYRIYNLMELARILQKQNP